MPRASIAWECQSTPPLVYPRTLNHSLSLAYTGRVLSVSDTQVCTSSAPSSLVLQERQLHRFDPAVSSLTLDNQHASWLESQVCNAFAPKIVSGRSQLQAELVGHSTLLSNKLSYKMHIQQSYQTTKSSDRIPAVLIGRQSRDRDMIRMKASGPHRILHNLEWPNPLVAARWRPSVGGGRSPFRLPPRG